MIDSQAPMCVCDTLYSGRTLQWFDDLGASFSLAYGKKGARVGYLDNPRTLADAVGHLHRGGMRDGLHATIGLLPEHSGNLALLDVDAHLAEFMRRHEWATYAPRVVRDDPDRAKFVCIISGCTPTTTQGKRGVLEIIHHYARRHAIISGRHESGELIRLVLPADARVPILTAADVDRLAREWIAEHAPTNIGASDPAPAPRPTTRAPRTTPAPTVDAQGIDRLPYSAQMRAAIDWFNADPRNVAKARAELERLPSARGYYAMRADDVEPSTKWISADAVLDYGDDGDVNRGVNDALEILCRATQTDKRKAIGAIVNRWRAAMGAPSLPVRRAGVR